jgi:hypothetical protein
MLLRRWVLALWLGFVPTLFAVQGCDKDSSGHPDGPPGTGKLETGSPENIGRTCGDCLRKIEAANPSHVKRDRSGDVIRLSLGLNDSSDQAIMCASQCGSIEEFSISCSSDVTPLALLQLLTLPKLRSLAVASPGLTIPGELVKGLAESHALESLSLNYVSLSPGAFQHLPMLKQISRLQLFHAGVGSEDLVSISRIAGLEYLDLSNNGLNEKDLTPLVALRQLRVLRVADIRVSPETEALFHEVAISGRSE